MKITTTGPSYQTSVLSQLPIHGDFLSFIRKKECYFIYKEKSVGFNFIKFMS